MHYHDLDRQSSQIVGQFESRHLIKKDPDPSVRDAALKSYVSFVFNMRANRVHPEHNAVTTIYSCLSPSVRARCQYDLLLGDRSSLPDALTDVYV